MRSYDYDFTLDPQSVTPLFLQLARGIADDIRRGRLRPGHRLPGSRTLARGLGVHRNTVVAAYDSLAGEGWVNTRPAGGTFVSARVPDAAPDAAPQAASQIAARVGFDWPAFPSKLPLYGWQKLPSFTANAIQPIPKGTLHLASGTPDLRLFPAMTLARSYRRVLTQQSQVVLAMGHSMGHPRLRATLAHMLAAHRSLVAQTGQILVTRGSLMALRLIAGAMLAPGDCVAVEDLGNPAAWEALHAMGARLVPIRVDQEGLDVDQLAFHCKRRDPKPIRAVYVTPHHQYPTTVVMSASRRLQLMQLAQQHRMAILEDDYDHDFYYEGRPVRPLASADPAGVVLYMGSLSKVLAPGLRLGFVVAPEPMIERMANMRRLYDMQGDLSLELALALMSEEGDIVRHVRRMRRIYHRRRDALITALQDKFGSALTFDVPLGGLHLWANLRANVAASAWAAACRRRHVAFHTAERFSFTGVAGPGVRLSFARLDEDELRLAVEHMHDALTEVIHQSAPAILMREGA